MLLPLLMNVGMFTAGSPQPQPEPERIDTGAGSGGKRKRFFEDEDELWLYIEGLKGQFKRDIEERKEDVAEILADAEPARAAVPFVHEPIDGLYTELDDLLSSTESLEAKWVKARNVEAEYRAMQDEEQEVVTLLMDFAFDDAR